MYSDPDEQKRADSAKFKYQCVLQGGSIDDFTPGELNTLSDSQKLTLMALQARRIANVVTQALIELQQLNAQAKTSGQ